MSEYALKDLKVWQEARKYRNEISEIVKSLPKVEKYRLADQLIRASRSVSANIAEGHGRFHYQENIQFCRQARGSLVEVYDHLTCALDEEYIDNQMFENYIARNDTIHRMINGYITYLLKRKREG